MNISPAALAELGCDVCFGDLARDRSAVEVLAPDLVDARDDPPPSPQVEGLPDPQVGIERADNTPNSCGECAVKKWYFENRASH
jgi:hypothetical protein